MFDLQQDTSPQLLLLLIQPLCQAETLATISKSSTACFAEQDAAARRNQESSTADAAALADSKNPDGEMHRDWMADKNVRITSNDVTENKAASVCVPAENTDVVEGAAQGLDTGGGGMILQLLLDATPANRNHQQRVMIQSIAFASYIHPTKPRGLPGCPLEAEHTAVSKAPGVPEIGTPVT